MKTPADVTPWARNLTLRPPQWTSWKGIVWEVGREMLSTTTPPPDVQKATPPYYKMVGKYADLFLNEPTEPAPVVTPPVPPVVVVPATATPAPAKPTYEELEALVASLTRQLLAAQQQKPQAILTLTSVTPQ